MKSSNKSREANLSFVDLESLAEEIRMDITNGKAYTMREYSSVVDSVDINKLGWRKCRAILFEPKLESYFPDSVFQSLKNKGREARIHRLNQDDELFIKYNIRKGIEWLADRFYTDAEEIYKKICDIGLNDSLIDIDFKGVIRNQKTN